MAAKNGDFNKIRNFYKKRARYVRAPMDAKLHTKFQKNP